MTKPSLPQGTRDFGPDVVRKRNYILNTIRNVFELYGFQPLETPAMENLDTLMGKYGEEGDKLIYRILDSGNPFSSDFFIQVFAAVQKRVKEVDESAKKYIKKTDNEEVSGPYSSPFYDIPPDFFKIFSDELFKNPDLREKYLPKLKDEISEKALKYDLTIPFARYVAMNHAQLTFPFKRYQIQPVWRADRPQKGRYREFYQCDADVVGSTALLNEFELATIYTTVFAKLGIDAEIKINSRKILTALAELCGGADKMNGIAIAIDKLDKTGLEKVNAELLQRGLNAGQVSIVEKYLAVKGSNEEILAGLNDIVGNTVQGEKGIEELSYLLSNIQHLTPNIQPDPTLARGLNYYTGIIFEVKAKGVSMGSIGGGGRYDDLTGLFGVPGIPGVGISFGVDRIYDVMEELNLFPADVHVGTQVLFFNLGEAESKKSFELMQQLRHKGIRCELYHENLKFDKQFKYAEKKNILYVIIIGEKELKEGTCNVKQLATGRQETMAADQLITYSFQ
ncbi:MAG: histidine--tRNA ligase [Bacteroidota bacterium]